MKATRVLIPLIIFLILILFLWRGLQLDPRQLNSALLNKPVPTFSIATLENPQQQMTSKVFLGHVSLLHVWATWCITCQAEHPELMDLSRTTDIPIYGLNYKDDRATAIKWLKEHGNPYRMIGFDGEGKVAIDLGVYGTPETYVIDSKGVIRYKLIGTLTPQVWQQKILPLIDKL